MDSLLSIVIKEKTDFIINYKNSIFQITSTYNQIIKEYEYKNISTIKLEGCENILKEKYNINRNESLLIFKFEYYIEGLFIPIITYEIFNPITKEKLNLNYCKDIIIIYNVIPLKNEDKLFLYDSNCDYYHDICSIDNTSIELDITLFDRKNEFNINNRSLCEKNCQFKEYNSETKKSICICSITNKSPLKLEDIINKSELLNNFINIKSFTNIEVMKCFKTLFSKDGLIYNIGNYILSLIILIFIISTFIFFVKGKKSFYNKIYNIIKIKKETVQNYNNKENISQIIKSNKNQKDEIFSINNNKSKKEIKIIKRNSYQKNK